MTAITHLPMDLLHADDQMELASSPAMPTEDIDFELDDVRDVSPEPTQDLMSQDEPEQLVEFSEPVITTTSEHFDDDLMLDEDTVIQHEHQPDLTDLNMDNNPDEPAQVDEDDDILYEEDEELQDLGGGPEKSLKEHKLDDDIDVESEQAAPEVQISDLFEEESLVAEGFESNLGTALHGAGDANSTSEHLQEASVEEVASVDRDNDASAELNPDSLLQHTSAFIAAEDMFENKVDDQNKKPNDKQAEEKLDNDLGLELDSNDDAANESKSHDLKANDDLPASGEFTSDSNSHPHADENVVGEESVDESTLQTPSLHTVKVRYLETEMCLFPPTEDDGTEMFFLQDVSLAHESLDNMLGACRDVLANTIGQDDELVLDVPSLGLHISEGSRYATQITLSQIVEVYLALGHNDNSTNVEPLYCSMSSRVCLASQYAYLQSAAKEGKTLTGILEENTFATGQVEVDGEDGLGREHEHGEINHPADLADANHKDEAFQESAETYAPQELEQELVQKSVNDESEAVGFGDDHDVERGSDKDNTCGPDKNSPGDSVTKERKGGDQSATSTVKGDSNYLEDDAALVSENPEHDEFTEDLFSDAAQESGLLEPNAMAKGKVDENPDHENNVQDSASSRTLEAENNQLEEDIFSERGNQTFEDENGNFPADQYDDEEYELKERNHENVGPKLVHADSAQLDQKTERDDPVLHQGPLSSAHALDDDLGISIQVHEEKDNCALGESEEDLLNFDDEEDGAGERQRNHQAFPATHQSKASENQSHGGESALNGSKEAPDETKEDQSHPGHSESNSLSEDLEFIGDQSPLGQPKTNISAQAADNTPSTPSGGKNGSKRKALEDEDDFDLFDTATPDKKRRRPSP